MTVESLPIRQLPSGSVVDDGRPLATLGITPEQISERTRIEWFDGHDDLDKYRAAVVSVDPDEARFALLAYRSDPRGETLLIGSPAASSQDVETLLHSLGIREAEVVDRIDARSPSSASLELSLEAEELQRRVESVEATLQVLTSAMERLRNDAAESQRTTLSERSAGDRDDLWLVEAVRRAPLDELSSRQREVLAAALAGSTNAEIAAALGIRVDTVRSHLRAVRNLVAHGH